MQRIAAECPAGRLLQLQSQLRQVSSQPFEAQLAEEMGKPMGNDGNGGPGENSRLLKKKNIAIIDRHKDR